MGAQLRIYRRRIRSVKATKKITKAMELISASRIVKAQQRVSASSPYATELTRAVSALATFSNVEHPLTAAVTDAKRAAVLIIASDRGMAGASRANDYGKVPMMEHIAQSNREITLALMIEDQQALDQLEDIAKVEGVDLIVVGPSDMSRTLGVTGTPNHPKLLAVIERLQKALKNGAGAKLALPINHPALPRDAGQLKAMGCAYANCAPSPEVRLMKSLQAQADEMRKQLT